VKREKAQDPDFSWVIPDGVATKSGWDDSETVKPPMPPEDLVEIYRKSSEVPKNARARGQNVAGFGWELTPVIKFEDPKLTKKASMFMYLDRVAKWRQAIAEAIQAGAEPEELKALTKNAPGEPTAKEIETEIAAWKKRAEMEHAILTIRLKNFCYEYPLQELIKRTEVNTGALAYCGWEILRDAQGTPIRAKLVEPMYMRPTEEDPEPVPVPWLRETSDVTYEAILVEKRFRRYCVQRNDVKIWFKEFGDPRVVSQTTGAVFADLDEFNKAKTDTKEAKDAKEATEIMLWAEYSPGAEPCGMPIWHGHSLDVETARASKEFDYDELAHGKMPRGVFTIIDAMIDSPVTEGFKKFLREGGIGNRNRVGVMEVATASMQKIAGAGRAALDFINFSDAQHDDATHLKLKESADSGVSQDFGNPPVLLGDAKSVQNRSVAEVSQEVAEEQTYTALRQLWDHTINQALVMPWGFRFWRFKLKAPRLQQAEAVEKLIKTLIESHVIRPDQAIPLAASLLGQEFLGEPAEWQKVPPKVAVAGMTKDFLPQRDNPMTVADESKPPPAEGDDVTRQPGETENTGEDGGEAAVGLLEALGMLVGDFTDGPAQKLRERLGLQRAKVYAEPSTGPDFWQVDD
jgi:capsid portal protein